VLVNIHFAKALLISALTCRDITNLEGLKSLARNELFHRDGALVDLADANAGKCHLAREFSY